MSTIWLYCDFNISAVKVAFVVFPWHPLSVVLGQLRKISVPPMSTHVLPLASQAGTSQLSATKDTQTASQGHNEHC